MKRARAAVTGIAAAALTVGVAAPAGAQEEPESLGFAVDKTQAQPGALVLGKVNAADVAEHCVTDLEEFQARFDELASEIGDPAGALHDRFFAEEGFEFEATLEHSAYAFLGFVAFGLSGQLGDQPAQAALPETFVMTFADIATQEPVGERDTFDPGTGEGSVVVPDIDPGLWAVAAACVGPSLDLDVLEAGIRAGADFLEEIGAPLAVWTSDEMFDFMADFLDSDATGFGLFIEFLDAIGPDLLEPIMVPDAFGAVVFCVLDAQGNCPDGEVEPPPGEQIEPKPSEEPTPAKPVVAAPTFTG